MKELPPKCPSSRVCRILRKRDYLQMQKSARTALRRLFGFPPSSFSSKESQYVVDVRLCTFRDFNCGRGINRSMVNKDRRCWALQHQFRDMALVWLSRSSDCGVSVHAAFLFAL